MKLIKRPQFAIITKEVDVMRQKGMMKIYTLEECMDEDLGVIGTPIRDAVEKEVREAVARHQESMRLKMESSAQMITHKLIELRRQFTAHNNKKTGGVFAPSIEWANRVFHPQNKRFTNRNELFGAIS